MKNIFVLISLLLIIPAVSAVQINMNSDFSQGQTLIAQVSGNFITQIQQQNVFLYNGHVRVSFIPNVVRIGNDFYVYGRLSGKSPGNYSLNISGVSYMQSGNVNRNDIIQNFTITNNTADFSITPGVIQTTQNFSINVQNLADNSITVNYFLGNLTNSNQGSENFFSSLFGNTTASSQGQSITIASGDTQPVYFAINNSNQDQLVYATLSTSNTQYEVPVFIPATQLQQPVQNNTNNSNVSSNLSSLIEIEPSSANVTMSTSASTSRYIYLYNPSQQNVTNISLSVSNNLAPYVAVQNESVNLANNSNISLLINITSSQNESFVQGQIIAAYANSTSYMNLSLNFSNGYISSQNETSLFQTCSQLNGEICNDSETCSGQTQNALDGVCCLSTCQPISNNQFGKIIGWGAVALIIIVLILFFIRRFRKAKRPLNLLNVAKRK